MNKFVTYILILLFSFRIIHAQQYNFKNYSVESGLPYVQVFTMFQDSKGYLWSGGYGGLSKFNGKTSENFSPKNGLANHFVNAIAEDKNLRILVGTIDGLSVFDGKKIINYSTKDGLPSENITAICIDAQGKAWIGTENGLCVFENKKIYPVTFLKDKKISCIYSTEKNGLWIGTNNGLYNENHGYLKAYTKENGLVDNTILSISENTITNDLFIGTKNGLSRMNESTKKIINYHISHGLIDETINAIISSKNGTTWIGSKNGLISFDGSTFSYYNIRADNNSNNVASLLIDYEGNLWIGTHSGLYRYRDKGFTTFGKKDGLGGAFVFQIIEDLNQNIWFTTESDGIFKYDQFSFTNFSAKNGILDNKVQSAIAMDDGSLWFGTAKGISKIKNGKIENWPTGPNLKLEGSINCFYKDKHNCLWIGSRNSICRMKPGSKNEVEEYYKIPVDAKECDVWAITEDIDGNIWAGTYLHGLFKLEGKEFKDQKNNIGIDIESALEIWPDNIGNLYMATLQGVFIYNTKTKKSKLISEKEGLSSELVYSLKLSKDQKDLWAGTNQGISKIDVIKLNNNIIDIVSYNQADGFEGVECNTHGIWEDKQSNIWFGTVNGLIKYSPKEYIKNEQYSKTTISSIKIDFIDTLLSDGAVLPHYLNKISFHFDGISLTNPDKVLYTYKLEGTDNQWSPPNNLNAAKYDNLTAGKYTFKVKSCNNEGLWNIEPTTFHFEIKQAFYKTWWFLLLLVSTAIAIVLIVFRIRFNQLQRKQKAEFDKKVEISKAELKALRAQMNPHFVFNSLNSIQHYILNSKSDEAAKYLNKFSKLMRCILNNSEKPTVTISEEIESLTLYLELEKMRFENKFNYSIKVDPSIDVDYDEIPPMLIQPYIENAILHGVNPKESTGVIAIEIALVNQFIKISVTDDGIGREKSKSLLSLHPGNKHKSLGMKITEDRVRILNDINQSNLNLNIIDLYDNEHHAIGTKVELYIPYIR